MYVIVTHINQPDHSIFQSIILVPMNNSLPTSPLSLANSPNGSPNHNDSVPITAHTTQPGELPLLDEIRPHYHCQPNSARTNPYVDALKYGMGSNSSSQILSPEPKLCSQLSGDITHPLPASLTIARGNFSMRVPLIYEGLHKVLPLCGEESQQHETCPKLPAQQKIQVVVQKFEEKSVCPTTNEPSSSSPIPPLFTENWVTVSPKKRVRPALGPRTTNYSGLKPQDSPIMDNRPSIPLVKVKTKGSKMAA
ncbi:hypothetical protein Cgig2_013775 [Carnegiea gigantea]|uniref:Uncharacterized protein n=1 Tax=Carnegiea gigantea TaxID=171969 RepID=A0A9Q1K974_9CARY|nr:hypothetical protein Cgig2_013775 [Carnegiea gigantea]